MRKRKKRQFRSSESIDTFMHKIQDEGRFLGFLNALLNTEQIVGEANKKKGFWDFLIRALSDPFLNITQGLIENKVNLVFKKQDAQFINNAIYYSYATIMVKRPFLYLIPLLIITVVFGYFCFTIQSSNNKLLWLILFLLVFSDVASIVWWLKWHKSSYIELLDTFHWFKKLMWIMTNQLAEDLTSNLEKLYQHRYAIAEIQRELDTNKAIMNASKDLVSLEYQINTDLMLLSSEITSNEYKMKGEEFHNCIDSSSEKIKKGDQEKEFNKNSGNKLKEMIKSINSDELISPRSKIINYHLLSESALIIRALESLSTNTRKYEELLRNGITDKKKRDDKTKEVRAKHEFVNKVLSMFYTDAPEASKQIVLRDLVDAFKISDVKYDIKGDFYMYGGDRINVSGAGNTVITKSTLTNVLNNSSNDSNSVEEVDKALNDLKDLVDQSGNEKALKTHESFRNQIASGNPDKIVLESLWDGLLKLMPTIAQSTTIMSNVVKLFT
jgi:hypothetical protein